MSYFIYMGESGFPLTRTLTKALAWAIAVRSGKHGRFGQEGPSENWWTGFRRRHPDLTLRKVDKLERSCAECLNPEVVKQYFKLLGDTLEKHKLTNSPRQIYNCDETFIPLDCSREKVIALKKSKNTYLQAQGTSEHITMLCAASAAGLPLPPMIIYSKSFPGGWYRFEGPDDALYAKSDSGWIDSELFLTWMKKIFLKHVVTQRPVLLFTDGHKSHLNLDIIIDLCRTIDIILFCLLPHTTHALQPLDVAVFKSLKDNYSKTVRSLIFAKPSFVVTKREFSKVPFKRAFSITNIKAGFLKCGIYPFNPGAVERAKMLPSGSYSPSESISSGDSSAIYSPAPTSLLEDSSSSSSCPLSTNATPSSSAATPQIFDSLTPSTSVTSAAGSSSLLFVSPPPPMVSPIDSLSGSEVHCSTSTLNRLVVAGLIPSSLADILVTPPVTKEPTKRITGARDLTANEYYEWLQGEEKKKEEAAELKQKKLEERQ